MRQENLQISWIAPLLFGVALSGVGPASAQDIFDKYAKTPTVEARGGQDLERLLREEIERKLVAMDDVPDDATFEIEAIGSAPGDILMIESMNYEPASGRFTALVFDTGGTRQAVRGKAPVTAPALVPVRRIEPGEIIGLSDLEPRALPLATLKLNVLRSPEDIVGKEARRALLPDRPVVARTLGQPRAVLKGNAITITLAENGLALTSPGKALEDGAIGSLVRVVNTHSNKIIHATVVADGLVRAAQAAPASFD